MTFKKKIISIILLTFFVIFGSIGVYAYGILSSMTNSDLDLNNLSINENIKVDGTINVALFGIDGREVENLEGDRADTIMIASINFNTGEIKLISVMRDLFVQITETDKNDYYCDKINSAYFYGGVEAEIRTMNENFDLNISDYAVVNFDCMVDAVDAVDGIDVDVKNEDVLYWTNEYIPEINVLTNHNEPLLTATGVTHLTGVQALAYCRNRYSDSDYGRTARQREVLQKLAEKIMAADAMTTLNLIRKLYPYVETSFSISEITSYAKAYLSMENKNFTTSRMPFDTLNVCDYISDVSYVIPTDLVDNVKVLHYFLFGNENYIPSELVELINSKIVNFSGHGSAVDWTVTTPQSILDEMALNAEDETGQSDHPAPETVPETENSEIYYE